MKRLVPFLIIALAVTAFLLRDRWLPQAPGQNAWLGAVDAKLTLVGPLAAGRLDAVQVHKGDDVKAGDVLFVLDAATAKAQVAQAEAAVVTAQKSRDDLLSGKRPEELAVYDAQLAEAKANLALAEADFSRTDTLVIRGVTAQAQFDKVKAAVDAAQARLAQIEASKAAAQLPAREDVQAAAASRIQEAEAALALARQHVNDLTTHAPVAGRVDDVFFAAGEVVASGQPVVSLLPPEALVLRFYVPEAARSKLSPGTPVHFTCDGCATALSAKVSHVFAQPEYTPPVIYSENARGKLVYQVEAAIDGAHPELQPGLPVQVEPLP